jgi:RES domain-containing protein
MMPEIVPEGLSGFVRVRGTFYRSVLSDADTGALHGSVAAGRYSRPGQRTLYMSATAEGVVAAMRAHPVPEGMSRTIRAVQVEAHGIFDLRDDQACAEAGIRRQDALAPWQDLVASGGQPPSWAVRARLEEIGAHGLIDPSRKASGLWHLVLFRWNVPGGPVVRMS